MISIDRGVPSEVMLRKGETIRWSADGRIDIKVGNAGGVELALDGKPVESLGPSGMVVSRTFVRE